MDDDIDIAMLRDDYEKAAKLFNSQSDSPYVFKTPSNDEEFCYPFGKIIHTKTILYEYGEKGIKTGVYIDVFVYDNSPDDEKLVKKIFKKRDFLGRVRRLKLPLRKDVNGLKKGMYIVGAFLMKPIHSNRINNALDKNARKYEGIETQNVSAFVDPYDYRYFVEPKSLFQNLIDIQFENKLYPAPAEYDYWLKVLYGNYLELPPVEQRVNQHNFEAYWKDRETEQ